MQSIFTTLSSNILGALAFLAVITLQIYLTYSIRLRRLQTEVEKDRLRYEYQSGSEFNDESDTTLLRQLLLQQSELLAKMASPTVVVNTAVAERDREPIGERSDSSCSELMREITHSLNTPLSQIEVAATRLQAEAELDGQPADGSPLARIIGSVNVSKAFLMAFRELTEVASSAPYWHPESLQQALEAAGVVYRNASGRSDVSAIVDLPDRLVGYSNSYVLSVILPLLENAIEASKADSKVSVSWMEAQGQFQISVANESVTPPRSDEIYEAGFTTKDKNVHQGLGLTAVNRLLTSHRGASLKHGVEGEAVKFIIALPRINDDR